MIHHILILCTSFDKVWHEGLIHKLNDMLPQKSIMTCLAVGNTAEVATTAHLQ